MNKALILIPLVSVLLMGVTVHPETKRLETSQPVKTPVYEPVRYALPKPDKTAAPSVDIPELVSWVQPSRDPRTKLEVPKGTAPELCIVRYLYSSGKLSIEACWGIAANMQQETGGTFDPGIQSPDGASVGLCQWLGARKQRLYTREDWYTMEGQCDFVLEELAEYGIELTGSAADCAHTFCMEFERPLNAPYQAKKRAEVAQELWDTYY